MTQSQKLRFLTEYLISERQASNSLPLPETNAECFKLFRSLVNVREASPVSSEFLTIQDEFLRTETVNKGITDLSDLTPVKNDIYLWQGDITTLKCDAVVNAANSGMTGCYCPCHGCIDNVIHTYAGIQLRLECHDIMMHQGCPEPTGKAKITSAYNLPCKYVIHTVGPIVSGSLTSEHCRLLESCYRSCLEIADNNNVDSIAFCCISTGEFHFPNAEAAKIATNTINSYKEHTGSPIKVIFNVFKDIDLNIYKQLL